MDPRIEDFNRRKGPVKGYAKFQAFAIASC
jgi:hypothetical protein